MQNKYIFDCTECSKYYGTLGALHSHISKKHTSVWSNPADTKELMKYTSILEVTETQEISVDEVKGIPSRNGLVDYFTGIIGLKS